MTQSQCDLCASSHPVTPFEVSGSSASVDRTKALLCEICLGQVLNPESMIVNHWHGLNESIWSENPAVKVLAWRILNRLSSETWAQALLDQLYMDDDLLEWAKAEVPTKSESEGAVVTKDSNGSILIAGDSVTLIKDLDVKGANFTAKRGLVVRNISLTDDPALIEGRVNGTQIVLKTCFLRKAT